MTGAFTCHCGDTGWNRHRCASISYSYARTNSNPTRSAVIMLAWVVSLPVWLEISLCFSWSTTCPHSYYNVDFITVVYLFIHFDVISIYLLVWGVLEDYGVSIGRLVLALTKKWHNFASTSAWQLLCDVSMYVYCLCFSFMLKYVRHSYMFWGRCLFCIPPPPPF